MKIEVSKIKQAGKLSYMSYVRDKYSGSYPVPTTVVFRSEWIV